MSLPRPPGRGRPIPTYLAAILDQTVVSGSNFMTGVLVAKAVTPTEYGQYTLYFAGLMMLAGVQNALVSAPLRVNSPGIGAASYFRGQIRLQWLLSGMLALTAGLALTVAGVPVATVAILVLCLAAMQTQEMGRVIHQVRQSPTSLLCMDITCHGLRLVILAILSLNGMLTAELALAVMAATGAFALLPMWRNGWLKTHARGNLIALGQENWRYGRWILMETLVSIVSMQLYVYLIAVVISAEASGAYGAVLNIVNTINVLTIGVMGMAVPQARKILEEKGVQAWRTWLWRLGLIIFTLSFVVLGLIGWFAEPILATVYTPHYVQYAHLMLPLAAAYVLMAANTVLSAACYTSSRPQVGFVAKSISAIVVLVAGYPLLSNLGLEGAVIGVGFTQLIWTAVYVYGLRRKNSAQLTTAVRILP